MGQMCARLNTRRRRWRASPARSRDGERHTTRDQTDAARRLRSAARALSDADDDRHRLNRDPRVQRPQSLERRSQERRPQAQRTSLASNMYACASTPCWFRGRYTEMHCAGRYRRVNVSNPRCAESDTEMSKQTLRQSQHPATNCQTTDHTACDRGAGAVEDLAGCTPLIDQRIRRGGKLRA